MCMLCKINEGTQNANLKEVLDMCNHALGPTSSTALEQQVKYCTVNKADHLVDG